MRKIYEIILWTVLFQTYILYAQDTEISAEKSNIKLHDDGISLTCRPKGNGVGFLTIYGIQLQKNLSTTATKVLASITLGENEINWQDESLRDRSLASFNLTSVSTAKLQIKIASENVKCTDASYYVCAITGQFIDLTSGTKVAGLKLSTRVDPDRIDPITVCPSSGTEGSKGMYDVGKAIQLSCRSTVGIPAGNILWCLKRSADQSYSAVPLNDLRISQEKPILIGCQNERRGILTYNVTDADDNTKFLCTTSITGTSSDCLSGPVQSAFLLNRKSTDAIGSVCVALENEGKVNSSMSLDDITVYSPSSVNESRVGTQIRLTCTGYASGSVTSLQMYWCIKRTFDPDFYSYPFESHIQNDDVKSVGICAYKMTSALNYNVSMADIGTEIMCQLGVTGMKSVCGRGRLNAKILIKLLDDKLTTSSLSSIVNPSTTTSTGMSTSRRNTVPTTFVRSTTRTTAELTTTANNEMGPSSSANGSTRKRDLLSILAVVVPAVAFCFGTSVYYRL